MNIPFFDLKRLHAPYEGELKAALTVVCESGWYVHGKCVQQFEAQFAEYLGVKHVVGVGNGLDALTLIVRAYKEMGKLSDGDEVLVPANTYIATVLAITENNLVPVLVEPDLDTYNIDINEFAKHLTPQTKAIMSVNLYGQIAEVDALVGFCDENELLLIEDNAQAVGARIGDKLSGTFGHAAGFSFYPTKNLGALGDGGAVVTDDDDLARAVRSLANYGSQMKYVNEYQGVNSRLDEVHAAALSVKLPYLDEENARRRAVAMRFSQEITNILISVPACDGGEEHVWHVYVLRVANRQAFMDYMLASGVHCQIHYPIAIHKQDAYSSFAHLSLPITEKICHEVVSLPMAPYLSAEEVDYIIDLANNYTE